MMIQNQGYCRVLRQDGPAAGRGRGDDLADQKTPCSLESCETSIPSIECASDWQPAEFLLTTSNSLFGRSFAWHPIDSNLLREDRPVSSIR